jgi:hypothetical protein
MGPSPIGSAGDLPDPLGSSVNEPVPISLQIVDKEGDHRPMSLGPVEVVVVMAGPEHLEHGSTAKPEGLHTGLPELRPVAQHGGQERRHRVEVIRCGSQPGEPAHTKAVVGLLRPGCERT